MSESLPEVKPEQKEIDLFDDQYAKDESDSDDVADKKNTT